MNIYKNNLEHLLEELHRIDLIISLNFRKSKDEENDRLDDLRGLFISENEVGEILQTLIGGSKVEVHSLHELEEIETLKKEIDRKKAESIKQGTELRLQRLFELFQLQRFELDALLICLAPELDLRYEKLYSYLQNDVTKKRPSVDLVIKLLCSSTEERLMARGIFYDDASLIRNRLIYLTGDGHESQLPLLSRSIKVDERIIAFLLGDDEIDHRIRNFLRIIEPKVSFNDIILDDNDFTALLELMKHGFGMKNPIFFIYGPYGTGKKMMAEAVCRELCTPLLVVDSKCLLKDEPFDILHIILREAMLRNSLLYFDALDVLWKEKEPGSIATRMIQELDNFPDMVFLSGESAWEPGGILKNHGFINLAFPLPSFRLRKRMWESFLKDIASADVDTNALAIKFKFSGGQIRDAIFTARNIAAARGSSKLSVNDLSRGCKAQSNKNLSAFARKIELHYKWEDIVLPKEVKDQLREISGYIRNKGTVYNDWGFDKKLALGKGLNVLFSGPSGTGKTMATEIIAGETGLDLYKIDLSVVVSKYIGETEKNLSKIFKEAETSNAILFFDEADALFGKRSEVKDAHDRYANIEIGYLLQRMEEYEGVVILATNLSKNIDDAFSRRMQFMIEFPFPDEAQRKLIWTGVFPEEAPRTGDIDYDFLSKKLKLAGGNIKNIALGASFYAAEESARIGMRHIIYASKREYQKIGKTFLKTDFEPYYDLLEAGDR